MKKVCTDEVKAWQPEPAEDEKITELARQERISYLEAKQRYHDTQKKGTLLQFVQSP